jgi:CRP-like cAMP-binding protein
MAKVDVGKLKEQALHAIEKRQYAKAAELYVQIAGHESDADWRQRAGEALRKAGDAGGAIAQLVLAAEGYARGGFLLKAIAVCKVVLQIDARHTATQAMLAGLFAQRDRVAPAARVPAARAESGRVDVVRQSRIPDAPAARVTDVPARARAVPTAQVADVPMPRPADVVPRGRPADVVPPGRPMEVVPLATVLGGRKSEQFADSASAPAAYEIELGHDDDLARLAAQAEAALGAPEPLAIDRAPEPPRASASIPPRAPARSAAKDDLDFSGLLDDESPNAATATAAARPLPRIPLFSSLSPDRLRHLIDRVVLRQIAPGDIIVRQGDRGGGLFVIVSGSVEIASEGPPRRVLTHLGEGQFFGELALLADSPRTATVAADAPTELLEISRELVSEIVADSPEVLKTLLRFFRDRLLERFVSLSPLFARLAPADAQTLAARFKFLELEPGMRVIREGERAPGLFVLLCGAAHVARGGRRVAALAPGDVFGEMSLLTRAPASASIETDVKCWALELERAHFQEIMVTYPQVLEYVSELALSRRERQDASADDRVDFL